MLRQKSLVFAVLLVFTNAMHCAETTKEKIKHSKKKSSWHKAVFSTRTALEIAALCATVYACKSMFHEPSLSDFQRKQREEKQYDDGERHGAMVTYNIFHKKNYPQGITAHRTFQKFCELIGLTAPLTNDALFVDKAVAEYQQLSEQLASPP